MARDTTIKVSLQADIRDLVKKLEGAEGITAKSARAMLRDVEKSYKAMERESARAAKAAAKNAGGTFDALASSVRDSMTGIAASFAGVGASAAAILALGQDVADARNELSDMSYETGISADTLAALRFGANAAGKDLGQFSAALGKFASQAAKAAAGAGPAADVFRGLGVSATDAEGRLRPLDPLFREVSLKLAGIEDGSLRSAAAVRIFGQNGGGLANVLQVVGGDLDQVAGATELVGTGMKLGAAQAAQYQRDMAVLEQVMDRTKARVASLAGNLVRGLAGGMQLAHMAGITMTGGLRVVVAQSMLLTSALQSGTLPSLQEMAELTRVSGAEIASSLRKETESFRVLIGSVHEQIDAVVDLDKLNEALTKGSDGVTTATMRQRAATAAAAAAAKAQAAAQREVGIALRHSSSEVRELQAEMREEAAAEREAQISMGEVAEATRVYAAAARDAATYGQVVLDQMATSPVAALTFSESMEVAAAAMQRAQRFTSAFGTATADVLGASQSAFEDFAEARTRQIERLEEANENLRASREGATADELRQIDRQIEANNRAIAAKDSARRADNRRAKKTFAASQATQIAMATANTAAAVTAGFAPPPLGAGPIGGAILAAPLAASLGAQIAIIARQKYTPSFAGGGLVASRLSSTPQDHVPILADPREGIVSPRGMAGLGEDGLDAINRGQPVGGGDIHLTAQLVLDRRVVGEVLTKVGGRSATRTGRLPVHT